MTVQHFEILAEEPSMEAFLRVILPSILGSDVSFDIYTYQGKSDLLSRLGERLRGYASWLPPSWRIVVLVDRDDDNDQDLKTELESSAYNAGLRTKRNAENWQVATRLAIEELEAWYFGDWDAVVSAFPGVKANVVKRAGYRNPDAISGGTWEAFERELQKAGHFRSGLRKIEAARRVGEHFRDERCSSRSYRVLSDALKVAQ